MHFAEFTKRAASLGFALLTSAHTANVLAAGRLDDVGQQVRRDARSPPPSTRSDSTYSSTPRRNGAVDFALGQLFGYVILSPWLIPNFALEQRRPPDAAYRVRFADYPYAAGAPGFLLEGQAFNVASIDDDMMLREEAPRASQGVAARIAVETGWGGGIMRNGFDARVQFPMRLELDTDWSLYRAFDAGDVDSIWMGREHISARFAESTNVQFRSGVGPQHLHDARGWVHGFDVTWGFDAFPGRPVVVAFEASAGLLGKAFAGGLSARIGLLQGPVELSAGWHQRWIADIPLGEPFLAIRFWL